MEIHILLFAAVLLVAHGGRVTRQTEVAVTEEECRKAPENTELVTCCELPTRHILGHIKDTIHFCANKMRGNEEEPETSTLPTTSDHKRHFFKHRFRDGCFVQCIFEQEGFLVDNVINKQALIETIQNTFMDYEEWQETVSNAVEKCLSSEMTIAANETCKSGSAEAFQCILKELFLQCPVWLEDNEYCTSLRNFYMKCPNGPPPKLYPRKKHSRRNKPKKIETESEKDTENPTEDM